VPEKEFLCEHQCAKIDHEGQTTHNDIAQELSRKRYTLIRVRCTG